LVVIVLFFIPAFCHSLPDTHWAGAFRYSLTVAMLA
jgi:hypothetical protein